MLPPSPEPKICNQYHFILNNGLVTLTWAPSTPLPKPYCSDIASNFSGLGGKVKVSPLMLALLFCSRLLSPSEAVATQRGDSALGKASRVGTF